MKNTQVVLAKRPIGLPRPSDFQVIVGKAPSISDGEFLIENLYISLDAGFRNWMSEGSGDDVLPAMQLGKAVTGLTLGRVVQSNHTTYSVGQLLMARLAWEEFSKSDGSDFLVPLDADAPEYRDYPLTYHLGILGDTGMSAYFGLQDIGRPQPGETVLISAAGGAVGSIAGQIAKLRGARTVGFAGSDAKCARLVDELGYDAAINHRSDDVPEQLAKACPNGVDVYFDNVGGALLEVVLDQITEGARIPFCGAVTAYNAKGKPYGPSNLFQLVVKSARLEGFMTHLRVDRYNEARNQLCRWLDSGQLKNVEYLHEGIESTGNAFCELFEGKNYGKSIVRVSDDAN